MAAVHSKSSRSRCYVCSANVESGDRAAVLRASLFNGRVTSSLASQSLVFRENGDQIPAMKRPARVPQPPVIALVVAIIGVVVIAFNLRPDRHGETMTSAATTTSSAQAAGATVSPTDDAVMAP